MKLWAISIYKQCPFVPLQLTIEVLVQLNLSKYEGHAFSVPFYSGDRNILTARRVIEE